MMLRVSSLGLRCFRRQLHPASASPSSSVLANASTSTSTGTGTSVNHVVIKGGGHGLTLQRCQSNSATRKAHGRTHAAQQQRVGESPSPTQPHPAVEDSASTSPASRQRLPKASRARHNVKRGEQKSEQAGSEMVQTETHAGGLIMQRSPVRPLIPKPKLKSKSKVGRSKKLEDRQRNPHFTQMRAVKIAGIRLRSSRRSRGKSTTTVPGKSAVAGGG